jgi:hypothetical protein
VKKQLKIPDHTNCFTGDIVMVYSFAGKLRQHFPGAQIDFLQITENKLYCWIILFGIFIGFIKYNLLNCYQHCPLIKTNIAAPSLFL